jgi:hypothetical protein
LGLACEVAGDRPAPRDAIALYQRACDLPPSLPRACLKAARASETVNAPPAVISTSYLHACELLSAEACRWVSEHVAPFDAKSPAIGTAFRRFCDAGEGWACAGRR